MRAGSLKYLVNQGFRSLWFNRVNTFASLCIVAISLVMVGFSVLVSANITRLIGSVESRNEVVVIIRDGTPDNNITILGTQLQSLDNVSEVSFYPKEDAWVEMQEDMTDEEKSLFDYIQNNPLPDSYRVRVSDISKLPQTVSAMQALDSVESVNAPNDFASLLTSIKHVCAVIFTVITAALIVVCLVIISNSTRSSVFARRREINIMRYVGASKSFIRIPFFVEGLSIGLIAAVAAFLLTLFGYTEIYNTLTVYLRSWTLFVSGGLIPFGDIALITAACYLVCGMLISSFRPVLATRKHLNP